MTIAVKYCGGCNPRFDRTTAVARLQAEFSQSNIGEANYLSPDLILVVCGCSSKCASHDHLSGRKGKFILSSPEEFDQIVESFRAGSLGVAKSLNQ